MIIAELTGNIKNFLLFLSIISIHELGHVLGAIYFKWNIEKIVLLPFGGLTIFNEYINRPIKEEFVICILGPLFQVVYYYLAKNYIDIKTLHYNLLMFNLLPIIPLDGSKLLNLLLNKFFSFKKSLIITEVLSIISIFGIIALSIVKKQLLLILILVFLLFKTLEEIKDRKYIINRFMLERLYNPVKNTKIKYVIGNNLTDMHRDRRHIFIDGNKYCTEKEIIKKMFDLNIKL